MAQRVGHPAASVVFAARRTARKAPGNSRPQAQAHCAPTISNGIWAGDDMQNRVVITADFSVASH
jgi:hypothetical protein